MGDTIAATLGLQGLPPPPPTPVLQTPAGLPTGHEAGQGLSHCRGDLCCHPVAVRGSAGGATGRRRKAPPQGAGPRASRSQPASWTVHPGGPARGQLGAKGHTQLLPGPRAPAHAIRRMSFIRVGTPGPEPVPPPPRGSLSLPGKALL
ncbi:unnamed protein product [Rangifer tarandus platyrhynchus]|uniref:WAS/WASL interacting protein family, member 3 n=2 Tax=Rangifer tarandus platyrhynchus TaxID=3082113 RepID=A0ABN8ZF84_RANTA|nr:unnamed protein product [Rangifer tarandus platyrhynchus]